MTKTVGDDILKALKSIDLNHNGIPDYEDPDFWLGVFNLASLGIIKFSPKHDTLAKTLATKYQEAKKP